MNNLIEEAKCDNINCQANAFGTCSVYLDCSEKLIKPIVNDKYNEYINTLLNKQVEKGLNKYSYMLQDNPAGIIERLNHLEEELADALSYLQWVKEYITKMQDIPSRTGDVK